MITVARSLEQKRADNAARAERRRVWKPEIDKLKLEAGCQWSGCTNVIEIPEQLEFAHMDQDSKEFKVGELFNYSPYIESNRERVRAEIAKCRILCSMHHRLETVQGQHSSYRRGNKAA